MRPSLPALLITAMAVPAAAQDADRVATFVAAIEGNGCSLTMAEAGTFFPANGFTEMSETREIVGALEEEGRLIRTPDRITVITDACPGDEGAVAPANGPDATRVDAFVTLLQQSDCDMSMGEAPLVFPANGFEDPNETRAIAGHLEGEGLLEMDQAAGMIRLVGAACPAS